MQRALYQTSLFFMPQGRFPHAKLRFMKARALVLALVATLFWMTEPASASVAKNAGTRGSEFLSIDVGGRHVALGGTYAAYGDDVFTVHGQPAALADAAPASPRALEEIGFQYNEWVQDISQQYFGLGGSIGPGRWAMTGNILGASGITRTTDDAFGRFGATNGTFGVHDYAVAVHYARRLGTGWSVGAAAKYLRSEIDDVSASGFAVDLGARYRVNDDWTLGASVVNLGQGLKFIRDRSDLPLTGRLGAAWNRGRWLATADLILLHEESLEGAAGIEWRPVDLLSLRAGYKTQLNNDLGEGLTAGLGLHVSNFTIDYGYVPFGPLGDAHRVSARFSF